ncbi:hypothetical protein BC835DRAFT_1314955 [Cytidiella melzeri]|nr:hypothetical protein BC835DRAFT_1314955 [Cytidiella melzeri]
MSAITPHRRPTASSRLRENRSSQTQASSTFNVPTTAAAAPRIRRKSRSPGAQSGQGSSTATAAPVAHRGNTAILTTFARKKRPGVNAAAASSVVSSNASSGSHPSTIDVDEFGVGRGRRWKDLAHDGRPISQAPAGAQDVEVLVIQDGQAPRRQGKGRRKDKEKDQASSNAREDGSRGATTRKDTIVLDDEEMEIGEESKVAGVSTDSDSARLKEELETLKKHLAAAKKTINKQGKTIDELKKDVANSQKSYNEEREHSAGLKAELKKSSDMVTTVESNLCCQICMELMLKPYGLSPCGHVLCLNCLQEWFRSTSPGDEDMDDDGPSAVLSRKKTCPVCRSAVFHRPIPLFVLKAIATAFDKAKSGSSRQSSPPHDGDPWYGIFPEAVSPYDDSDDDSGEEESYDYDDDDEGSEGPWPFAGYGSDSEEEEEDYDGNYVHQSWSPPTVLVHPDDYPFEDMDDNVLSMLRRGATPQMIMIFDMSYTHSDGLMAKMSGNSVYLGWNISLQPDDITGEEFMEWIEADIVNHRERWEKADNNGGTWTAWRLVREEEDEEFDMTDSDIWAEEDLVGRF